MTTDITVLLDRSQSMSIIRGPMITGYNQFLREQQAQPGAAHLTFNLFDAFGPLNTLHYDTIYSGDLAKATPLTYELFVPRGNTPLIDAMDRVIDDTGKRLRALPEAYRPDRVVLVIITDGQENASHLTTRERVMTKVEHQRDVYKWDFLYLGANQDAVLEAQSYGIPLAGVANYTNTNAGGVFFAASQSLNRARSSTSAAASFTPDELAALVDDSK